MSGNSIKPETSFIIHPKADLLQLYFYMVTLADKVDTETIGIKFPTRRPVTLERLVSEHFKTRVGLISPCHYRDFEKIFKGADLSDITPLNWNVSLQGLIFFIDYFTYLFEVKAHRHYYPYGKEDNSGKHINCVINYGLLSKCFTLNKKPIKASTLKNARKELEYNLNRYSDPATNLKYKRKALPRSLQKIRLIENLLYGIFESSGLSN